MFDPTEQELARQEYNEDLDAEEAQAKAEWEAEQAAERFWEERGVWQDDLGEDMRRNPFDPIWQM
jgi:hypothetical protein